MTMQHPWILPFLPLTTAHPIQLALPHHPHHAGVQQVPTAATMQSMGLTLQPVLTPSGTLLVPALNAAAAAAAVAAAAHHHQQQQQQQQGSYSIPSPSVLINSFPRARLKVSERENRPTTDLNGKLASEKRKHHDEAESYKDVKRAKIETRALKAKRPGFSEERYNETEYYFENGLRKVYPYYFTFTTFTKGRWVGEKILDVFAREFRAHPVEEYERCIKSGTLTVNYEKVDVDYRLKHNDLLANIVHRHETPVVWKPLEVVHVDDELIVVDKPCSIPVHPCGRYRHNTVAFILAKEHNLRNLRTIHRLDRLTSGLLMFGRTQEKARSMEQQIRTRQVVKEYVCRVEGEFTSEPVVCNEPIEVVSYKIGVCRVSPKGKECRTEFERLSYNGKTSVVLCRPHTGRMHQIRVHLQYLGYPIVNDPLYNHVVFGSEKGKNGNIGKTDEELIRDLISIHNAENWLGADGDDFGGGFFSAGSNATVAAAVGDEIASAVEISGDASPSTKENVSVLSQDSCPISTNAKAESVEVTSLSAVAAETVPKSTTAAAVEDAADVSDDKKEETKHKVSASDASDSSVASKETSSASTKDCDGETSAEKPASKETDEPADSSSYNGAKLTHDEHCYECKVRFRDPKPKDLMMFLHAWRYKGPGWEYETRLPSWAQSEWQDDEY